MAVTATLVRVSQNHANRKHTYEFEHASRTLELNGQKYEFLGGRHWYFNPALWQRHMLAHENLVNIAHISNYGLDSARALVSLRHLRGGILVIEDDVEE